MCGAAERPGWNIFGPDNVASSGRSEAGELGESRQVLAIEDERLGEQLCRCGERDRAGSRKAGKNSVRADVLRSQRAEQLSRWTAVSSRVQVSRLCQYENIVVFVNFFTKISSADGRFLFR